MKKRIIGAIGTLFLLLSMFPLNGFAVPQPETKNYKVAFYPYDCYHMESENGRRSGYGYEMMQGLAKYLQCTFSFVGYDKSAKECEEMLRTGELDIYTAAKKTPEREAEFAFTTHPAITSYTCMNIKVGNRNIVAGDYATYNGIRVGLLRRHTYNNTFLDFMKEKGFTCEIVYYETPTELSNALVNDDVDALVDSYIRIPEDEISIENFGETPYYIMARKEDQQLIDDLDYAFDSMNVETPNWRTELYTKYYGSEASNRELTRDEQQMLQELQAAGTTVLGVMNPDNGPYSWFEDGEAQGIVADLFRATAEELGLPFEIVQVDSKEAYKQTVASGSVDLWLDMTCSGEDPYADGYKMTDPYLTTSMSVLRRRGTTEKIETVVVPENTIPMQDMISKYWPDAKIVTVDSLEACKQAVVSGRAEAAVLMSYAAQKLSREDMQNRLRVEIIPEVSLPIVMGVRATDDVRFYGLWEKTLSRVSERDGAEIVQRYLEQATVPTFADYLFDHPTLLIGVLFFVFLFLSLLFMYVQSNRSKKKQERISNDLSLALEKAEEATKAKQEFFSKMSHDIRTPLNVVLGMTQIAEKYQNDRPKLENALHNITQEGNYLLVMINSILDVNQLEHGTVELMVEPFNPADTLRQCADMLSPLAGKKEQTVTVTCDSDTHVVRGDVNRLKQILINIVSNAIKYTDVAGEIALRLECLPENRYRFTCKDNGVGMPEEFVKHICDDFVRVEDSRVSKIQGTGLGMSVVKGFTDLMGGQLTIESALGKGSTFTVEFPFEDASEEERETILHPPVEETEKPGYFGKKVLLVEDNTLNAEIAIELLHMIGLTVDWAENGEIGIKDFEASRTDEYFAVFMDMQMPVMDGVTATKLIRGSKRVDHDIPIFAMTANTFASDRRKCREAGMNGYIPKPVSVKDIEDALTEIHN